jgi:phage-related protein
MAIPIKMPAYMYKDVVQSFIDKGCSLLNTKEEFDSILNDIIMFNKTRDKLPRLFPQFTYVASCGCKNTVYYNVFLNRGTGVICPKCTSVKNAKSKKEENIGISNIELELDCITYFDSIVKEHFEIIKCFDGCKCDIAFRPLNITDDIWCGIQVKTTNLNIREYPFHLNNCYENLIILCICYVDKKMWAIPYENVKDLKKITIGLKKSKYNIYELTNENIISKLNELYNNSIKFNFETLDTPSNIYQKREKEYRRYRENILNFIKFDDNKMEGMVYDFKIGNKKVQEKVGGIKKDRNSYNFCLWKNNGKIDNMRTFTQYKSGDNDLYWLNCEGKKNFYVIPEKILIEYNFIGNNKKRAFGCNPLKFGTWYNEYLFDYENIDKERLLKLIY